MPEKTLFHLRLNYFIFLYFNAASCFMGVHFYFQLGLSVFKKGYDLDGEIYFSKKLLLCISYLFYILVSAGWHY